MAKREVKQEVSLNHLLLVEGKNDQHVVWSLLKHYNIPENFEVRTVDGVGKISETFEEIFARLLDIIEVELTRIVEGRVGVIVDADTNLSTRWQSIRDTLTRSGYSSVPREPVAGGAIIRQNDKPVVGIWLMPDNKISGMLEDFVGFLKPQDDLLWPMVDEAVQKVKAIEESRRFRDVHESKARIHTWLAWQEEPGKPMGQAITARYLDANAAHARELINWIRRLFALESA